jgi:anti-sigma factor RsiW
MSKHVTEWLHAYLDGELKRSQLQQVEIHLVECQACRDELESLARISSLLHEVPAPEFTPPERFAAQVSLRLPYRPYPQPPVSKSRILEIGWWMIPVGLLGVWVFIGTSYLVNDILAAANNLGLLAGISDWLVFDPASETYWSATLARFGILSGNTLDWAASTEALTRTSLPLLISQVSIALLYLSWIAIWWARRRRQEPGQLLEG